jgi:hypothetical protein
VIRSDVLEALALADPASIIELDPSDALRAVRGARVARPHRRRLVTLALSIGALVAALVPTGALASGWMAQTGWFGSPNPPTVADEGEHVGSSDADSSQWLSVTAPDFVEAAADLLPDYVSLPAGFDRARFATAVAQQIHDGIVDGPDAASVSESGALMQETGVISMLELHARCEWRREWITAYDAGDTALAAHAVAMLAEAATWPATVSTDGGGVVAEEQRLADAAASGDRATVVGEGMRNCPALPAGAGR